MTPLDGYKASWQAYKNQFKENPAQKTTELIQQTLSCALFIIGCVGAAGAFPGHSIGWLVAAINCAMLILTIPSLKDKKCTSFLSVALSVVSLTVGILGGAGVLSATQVGWGCIGAQLSSIPLACCCVVKEVLEQKEAIIARLQHQMLSKQSSTEAQ